MHTSSRRPARPARVLCALSWAYAGAVLLWVILHAALGDSVWWLALANAFVPFLFAPLVIFVAAALVLRRGSVYLSVLSPVIVFLALYSHLFLPQLRPRIDPTKPRINVATFNLWAFSSEPETLDLIVGDAKADIIALQEVNTEMRLLIDRTAAAEYPHVLHGGHAPFGVAILSRYALTQVSSPHLAGAEGRIQAAIVDVDGEQVAFYNIHLPAINALGYFDSGHPMSDQIDPVVRARAALAARLVSDIQGRALPSIVAGDLNGTDQGEVHRLLVRQVADAHDAVGWGFGHTFPSYGGSWRGIPILPRQMRIDMIFTSPDLVALDCTRVVGPAESDHLPVVASLAWRTPTAGQ